MKHLKLMGLPIILLCLATTSANAIDRDTLTTQVQESAAKRNKTLTPAQIDASVMDLAVASTDITAETDIEETTNTISTEMNYDVYETELLEAKISTKVDIISNVAGGDGQPDREGP
jgi:hypothetical protein